ncbi:MAG: hypothetical protein H0T53_11990 [Herpetosiphonaceae bacterium]|nr:hypothetical protein [Herpetosiphonaceae bacterium]
MTDYVPTLNSLRVAHGEFVATVLTVARKGDPSPFVHELVTHNRWIATQLREIYQRPHDQQQPGAAPSDVASLLAELAASCADVGAAVRSLPTRAQPCGAALVAAVIGQYYEQTARLRGGFQR